MVNKPIPVTLAPYEWRHAATVGLIRHISSRTSRKRDLRGINSKDMPEVYFVDINGAMGELAFAKAAGLYWPGSVNVSKTEPDVFPDWQVRTARDHSFNLIIRPDDPDHFRYVLVTGTGPEFQVRGYIRGSDAKRPELLSDRGGRGEPAYWIAPEMLDPVDGACA